MNKFQSANAELRDLALLYEKPLPSSRKGPLYNAFSYPTKISPEAIALFIATHTKPGSMVLDTFGGSGTTGLATLLCDKPTEEMKIIAANMGMNPEWGPRSAAIYDIGTLGSFVAQTLCSPPDPEVFARAAKELLSQAKNALGWIYAADDPDGNQGEMRHAIWSDVLVCPCCGVETSYWQAAVRRSPLTLESTFRCPSCKNDNAIDDCERATEVVYDAFLGMQIERKKRLLVRIYGQSDKAKWQRDPTMDDLRLCQQVDGTPFPSISPKAEIEWGDLYRSGYHKGISHLHHFYTSRNFLAMATLWDLSAGFANDIRDALRLLILSYNATHSTLMTRVVVKQGQNDFVLTGAQSGVLYVSGLPVEKNVFEGIKRKITHLKQAFAAVYGSRSKVSVVNASSTALALSDSSVDYVFTDPPFGGYIPYAEINQINEIWLGKTTDRTQEIIVSGAQQKSVDDYGIMLGQVFGEISRVLKPSGLATVVFHSSLPSVWQALARAYGGAGFKVQASSVLDKLQASFKQTVSTVSVKGDPLLLLVKDNSASNEDSNIKADEIMVEILDGALTANESERHTQRLYSRFINRCLELGVTVPIGAKEFYARAETAFRKAS